MNVGRVRRTLILASLTVALFAALVDTGLAEGPRDEDVREIGSVLVCPLCEGQPVAVSSTPQAQQVRELIRKKLSEGESREQIIRYFVERYGESVVRDPVKEAIKQIVGWPLAAGIIGGGVLVAFALYRRQSPDTFSLCAVSGQSSRPRSGGSPALSASVADVVTQERPFKSKKKKKGSRAKL